MRLANGLGYLPLGTAFDPTHNWPVSLTSILVPTEQDIQKAGHLYLSAQTPGYGGVLPPSEVMGLTMEALRRAFGDIFVKGQVKNLKDKGLSVGIVSEGSNSDVEISLNSRYHALLTNISSEVSVMPGMAQAAATATNFCIGLRNTGIPVEQCVVPVVVNTGMHMCFAATILCFCEGQLPDVHSVEQDAGPVERSRQQAGVCLLGESRRTCPWLVQRQPPCGSVGSADIAVCAENESCRSLLHQDLQSHCV